LIPIAAQSADGETPRFRPAFGLSPFRARLASTMDTTLLTILLLLALATALALIRSRRRDRCLRSLQDFHVTLAEHGHDLTWGRMQVYATGLEVEYPQAVVARGGHLERSFIFYNDQFDAMTALYRCPRGLSDEEHERRSHLIARTVHPGLHRRVARWIRNWLGMVRDALVQAVGLVIGVAKTQAPGSAVFGTQEQQVKALSGEIIGHTGNAFDPLLERHLFTQVVVEITADGTTRSYCGWLKDYSSQFIEVLDAYANTHDTTPRPVRPYAPADDVLPQLNVRLEEGRIYVTNRSERFFYVEGVDAGSWHQPIDAVLPPGYTADLTLPPDVDPDAVRACVGTADRVDMVVPRRHALVRHAAGGSDETYREYRQRQHQQAEAPAPAHDAPAPASGATVEASPSTSA
jgi:hypothetical protein